MRIELIQKKISSERYIEEEKEKIRAVLDTNIYVSALFWKQGNPHRIIQKGIDEEIEIFASEEIIEELRKILKRDFNENDKLIKRQINFLLLFVDTAEINQKIEIVKEDADDNKIIECAIASNAKFIVSGDNHLLKIRKFRDIKIVSPKEFLDILSTQAQ